MDEHSENWIDPALAYLRYQVALGVREVRLTAAPAREGAAPDLVSIRADLGECTRCRLHETRTTIVFGEGNPGARLMFIGEGPGRDEDLQGRPFVGRAGRLLTRMIEAMTFQRSDVYIANVVKCRPPQNRNPKSDEIETCFPFLEAQVQAIAPEVIVALGRVAASTLLETNAPMGKLRGKFQSWKGIPVMPTYHPSFLLRNEGDRRWKADAWSDLKMVMAELGIPVPDSGNKP
jgi:uracil-DNA glycosylase family 4